MITEIAMLTVDSSEVEAFEKMYQEVVPVLRKQPGYLSDTLMHAIERPDEYILAVEWESVKDHERFIESEEYPNMSGPFGEFVKDSSFAHYRTVS